MIFFPGLRMIELKKWPKCCKLNPWLRKMLYLNWNTIYPCVEPCTVSTVWFEEIFSWFSAWNLSAVLRSKSLVGKDVNVKVFKFKSLVGRRSWIEKRFIYLWNISVSTAWFDKFSEEGTKFARYVKSHKSTPSFWMSRL